ncbi:hypothetical protein, partial [Pseudomonas syringae]|uniref:hypothetical protein n=1 Tax=Pseudomonas syringae TaxID=317 RepID=UPI001982150E
EANVQALRIFATRPDAFPDKSGPTEPCTTRQEGTCPRRGQYIRNNFGVSDTAFAGKVDRHPGRSNEISRLRI